MMEPLTTAKVMHFCPAAIFAAEKRAAKMAAVQSFRKATAPGAYKSSPVWGTPGLKAGYAT